MCKFMSRGSDIDHAQPQAIEGDHVDALLDVLLGGTAALELLVAGLLSAGTVKPSAVDGEWRLW